MRPIQLGLTERLEKNREISDQGHVSLDEGLGEADIVAHRVGGSALVASAARTDERYVIDVVVQTDAVQTESFCQIFKTSKSKRQFRLLGVEMAIGRDGVELEVVSAVSRVDELKERAEVPAQTVSMPALFAARPLPGIERFDLERKPAI